MGKSPGKWIKTLFGKKSTRSDLSKGRASLRSTYGNEAVVAAKAEPAVSAVVPSEISQPISDTISRSDMNTEVDKGVTSNVQENVAVLVPAIEDADVQRTTGDVASNDLERSRQENAATKAQAAFRGYLARRAFRALRGIIRLQALVRGHLVRRQAVATLCCIHGVVKLQALFRGVKIRNSGTDLQVRVKCNVEKHQDPMRLNSVCAKTTTWTENPSRFVFISKILRSSPVVMPLHLQYDIEEPNSARNWLERWTISSSWKPLPQQKKLIDANCETSEGNSKTVELEAGRPKRSVRRVSSSHADNGSVHPPSESAKPKRNVRKFANHFADSVQERSQNELEKVKRSLRKVTNSTEETTNQLDVEIEKPKRSVRKASNSPVLDVPNQGMGESGEKMMEDAAVEIPKHQDMETTSTPLVADELDDVVHNAHLVAELPPLDTHKVDDNENINVTNGEVISKEDQTSNENQKTKRRASFPAKQEYAENGAQNSPTVPSYMAATASAKAKLRGQGSPRLGLDGDEKTGFIRRHSLPSAPNGKLSSVSPRMQKLAQPNGKGGVKNDRSPLSSRDDKVAHADWRR